MSKPIKLALKVESHDHVKKIHFNHNYNSYKKKEIFGKT